MPEQRKLQVFLSYAREDKAKIRELTQRLVAEGWIKVWLDEINLLPGQDWHLEIERATERADVVLVCLSKRSVVKESYFQKEVKFILDVAREKPEGTIFIIPVRLEYCFVPTGLSHLEWVDVFSNDGFDRIMKSMAARAQSLGVSVESTTRKLPQDNKGYRKWYSVALQWLAALLILSALITSFSLFGAGSTVTTPAPGQTSVASTDAPPTSDSGVTQIPTDPILPDNKWVSPKDGMTMIRIDSGGYQMGNEHGPVDQQPAHDVSLSTYWIDETEVTNAMFKLFIQTTAHLTDAQKKRCSFIIGTAEDKCVPGATWDHPSGTGTSIQDLERYPVIHVSWNDANAYCLWRGSGSRLPTEAEWERAARGDDGRLYPWGNQSPTAERLNYRNNIGATSRTGIYPKGQSPYGLFDMAGNVSEWVADWYSKIFYASSPLFNPTGPQFGQERVTRGGSWNFSELNIRTTYRREYTPDSSNNLVGFRCARSVE